jgi:Family of unknown function (DUF5681)
MKKKKRAQAQSDAYTVGYRRPPKRHQFRTGQSGNPSGKRKRPPSPPDLKAQLESELDKTVTIRSGGGVKIRTKGAAGIEQLVDQFAKGERNARRDLMLLSEKLGVDLTNREALQSALEDALFAEDEALLADFVRRHGGQYPPGADAVRSLPAEDANLLSPPNKVAKLLAAPPGDSTDCQMVQPEEKCHG